MEQDKLDNLKIRQLVFNDVYKMTKILKNLKLDWSEKDFAGMQNGKLTMARGINIIKDILVNSEDVKPELNEFLGGLFNISGEEFGELPIDISFDCMQQISQIKGLDRFFKSVGSLMN